MAKAPHSFKRLVLGLQPGTHGRSMRLAVELADLLHLELLGIFLEDTSLQDFANLPFSRELRTLGDGWHAMDLDRLLHDFELSARGIERQFTNAAQHLPNGFQFTVARGAMATTLASLSRTGDIVMIVEPRSAAERATQQFSWLVEAAFQSASAVMLVPPHIARTRGPVIAISTSYDDPSVDAAAAIASAANEKLLIIEVGDGRAERVRNQNLAGTAVECMTVDTGGIDPATYALAFRPLQERLVVMTRGSFADKAARTITAARRVPVLVVEPSTPLDPHQTA